MKTLAHQNAEKETSDLTQLVEILKAKESKLDDCFTLLLRSDGSGRLTNMKAKEVFNFSNIESLAQQLQAL